MGNLLALFAVTMLCSRAGRTDAPWPAGVGFESWRLEADFQNAYAHNFLFCASFP